MTDLAWALWAYSWHNQDLPLPHLLTNYGSQHPLCSLAAHSNPPTLWHWGEGGHGSILYSLHAWGKYICMEYSLPGSVYPHFHFFNWPLMFLSTHTKYVTILFLFGRLH
jgi:hypothetical protein